MQITHVSSLVVSLDYEGNVDGDWVSETRYKYIIAPHQSDRTLCTFQIIGQLNLDFAGGGSIQFVGEVMYQLAEIQGKPMGAQLIKLAKASVTLFKNLFFQALEVTISDPNVAIWSSYDNDEIAIAIGTELINAYPKPSIP